MTIRPSPVVALNRAIAVAQNEGPERGLEEIRSITDRDRLAAYPFYPAALGELELRRGRHETAREHFRAAIALARNPMERRFLDRRVGARERDSTFCRSSGQVREDDAVLVSRLGQRSLPELFSEDATQILTNIPRMTTDCVEGIF